MTHPIDAPLVDNTKSGYTRLRSCGIGHTRWKGGFWGLRFRQCAETTLPHLYARMDDSETGHALTNLRIATGELEGEFKGTAWQDEWVYKWVEAASIILGKTGDSKLDAQIDGVIAVIAKAQEKDGYIASQIQVPKLKRFADPHNHELYVMGHLITAACVHHRCTGKKNLLAVAIKSADYMHAVFHDMPAELAHAHFNPSNIMALVDLYRTTGDKKYLDLADTFMTMQGSQPGGGDKNQDRKPLRQEREAVGHMVLGSYLYAGAADIYMETGDRTILPALDAVWKDLTETKMYITGGVCALHKGFSVRFDPASGRYLGYDELVEGTGDHYELPSQTAYNETCAQIGVFMWNFRMLQISGDAKYAHIMERCLYNSIISGIGLDGASWFYSNLLRYNGKDHLLHSNDFPQRFQPGTPPGRRQVCCPSNLLRTIAELESYAYVKSEDGLYAVLYGSSVYDDGSVRLVQETAYPFDGRIIFKLEKAPAAPFALYLRIPPWAAGASVKVNGKAIGTGPIPEGWHRQECGAGSAIELTLPMQVKMMRAHPFVEHTRNQTAVMRGPLVYCLESADLPPDLHASDIHLPRNAQFEARHEDGPLGGFTALYTEARVYRETRDSLYRELEQDAKPDALRIRLIPYYAWCNRGVTEMTVWLPIA